MLVYGYITVIEVMSEDALTQPGLQCVSPHVEHRVQQPAKIIDSVGHGRRTTVVVGTHLILGECQIGQAHIARHSSALR